MKPKSHKNQDTLTDREEQWLIGNALAYEVALAAVEKHVDAVEGKDEDARAGMVAAVRALKSEARVRRQLAGR